MTVLDRLDALRTEATPGPWCWTVINDGPWQMGYSLDDEDRPVAGQVEADTDAPVEFVAEGTHDADAALIVAAVNALPALLRIARAAEAHADRRGAGMFCGGGVTTCETCVGSCGIEEYYELRSALSDLEANT